MIEVKTNNKRETIEQEGEQIFKGKTTAKDFRSWLQGRINLSSKKSNSEYEFFYREVLRAYNHFNPLNKVEIGVDSWHGTSSFELIKGADHLTIIKFQKKSKGQEPTEVRTEVSRGEIISLLEALKFLSQMSRQGDNIETREIAFQYCLNQDIRHTEKGNLFEGNEFWTRFFASRSLHNKLTLMLGALDKLNLIKYEGGKTRILEPNLSINLVL